MQGKWEQRVINTAILMKRPSSAQHLTRSGMCCASVCWDQIWQDNASTTPVKHPETRWGLQICQPITRSVNHSACRPLNLSISKSSPQCENHLSCRSLNLPVVECVRHSMCRPRDLSVAHSVSQSVYQSPNQSDTEFVLLSVCQSRTPSLTQLVSHSILEPFNLSVAQIARSIIGQSPNLSATHSANLRICLNSSSTQIINHPNCQPLKLIICYGFRPQWNNLLRLCLFTVSKPL